MPDLLDVKRKEIADRLTELQPVVDEYNRLTAASSALAAIDGSPPATVTTTTAPQGLRPGRPRVSGKAPAAGRPPGRSKARGGRPKGGGKRAAQALRLIRANPGITMTALSEKMRIKGTYLYRVLPKLEQEGKIRKDGRGWHPG